jgi:hypothetical protein
MIHRWVVTSAVLIVAACTPGAETSSTTVTVVESAASTVTTAPTTTTATTLLTTTTTTHSGGLPNLDGMVFPTDPQTVDDLPAFLTTPIDAPAPDPDLTVDGPGDAEKWIAEWVMWMAWVRANPEQSQADIGVGWLPDTPMTEDTLTGLTQSAAHGVRVLGWPFYPISVSGTFDEAFENGQLLNLIVVTDGRVPTYTIDSYGAVVEVREPFDTRTTLRLILRPNEEEEWRVEAIEASG